MFLLYTVQVSEYQKKMAGLCPMTAPEVLKAIVHAAFYIAEPMVYLKTGVS